MTSDPEIFPGMNRLDLADLIDQLRDNLKVCLDKSSHRELSCLPGTGGDEAEWRNEDDRIRPLVRHKSCPSAACLSSV